MRKTPLTADSVVNCSHHGPRRPTFVCRHLVDRSATPLFVPDGPPDPGLPLKEAWCEKCDAVMQEQRGWNDVSEGFAGVTMICDRCYEDRRRAIMGAG